MHPNRKEQIKELNVNNKLANIGVNIAFKIVSL